MYFYVIEEVPVEAHFCSDGGPHVSSGGDVCVVDEGGPVEVGGAEVCDVLGPSGGGGVGGEESLGGRGYLLGLVCY